MELLIPLEVENKTKREIIEKWYISAFPVVARFVKKMGGGFDDAKDIFQDALVIYYEKTMCSGFDKKSTDEAYILGIAKHLWTKKYKKDILNVSFESIPGVNDIPDDFFPTSNVQRLLNLLERSGKRCLDLLTAFYFQKQSMDELAETFGFQSARSATVQKYKCIEKIREDIKTKSIAYEEFFE